MASLQGFTDGSYDYKQTYIFQTKSFSPSYQPDSIMDFLTSEQIPFAHIIEQTDLKFKYGDRQADFTLFVPQNLGKWVDVTDTYKLKQFVLYHTLERTVGAVFLQSSPAMKINTRLPGSRIVVENIDGGLPILNRESRIVSEHRVGNANLIFIDNCLSFSDDPII
jgi:hypothetical protein